MYNKIINPETGKSASTYSELGKEIIKNYLLQLDGGASKLDDVPGQGPECNNQNIAQRNQDFINKCVEDEPTGSCLMSNMTELYPGNDRSKWIRCNNPGDGHCFYWTLYRYLRAINEGHEYGINETYEVETENEIESVILNLRLAIYNKAIETYAQDVRDLEIVYDRIINNPDSTEKLKIDTEANLRNLISRDPKTNNDYNNMKAGIEAARRGESCSATGWAEQVDVKSAAKLFNICICIWDDSYGFWTTVLPTENASDLSRDCENVLYCVNTSGIHYDSLVPVIDNDDPNDPYYYDSDSDGPYYYDSDDSDKYESNNHDEEKEHMVSQIVNMGFDEAIAMDAVERVGVNGDINDALNYLMR